MSESYAEFTEVDGSVRMAGGLQFPQATPSDVLTVQDDGTIAAAAGGGGGAGNATVRGPFSFAFDTPGLADGVEFYTPTVSDVLLNAWIVVDEAFDGTTPSGDIGTFIGGDFGFFGNTLLPIDLTQADDSPMGDGILCGGSTAGDNFITNAPLSIGNVNANASSLLSSSLIWVRRTPALVSVANPLLLVVSQDGSKGGAAIDSTAGAGRVYIVTATPTSFA